MVVSIHKKGDQTCMDNYRGISLIGIALKLLCMVVVRRIATALESQELLVPEQAGFRSREECVGQATALYEVCNRRAAKGLPTYAMFIDFRKAYDTVPHEALLRKLRCIGIKGRALAFIQSLYSTSEVVVRVGSHLSEPFPLKRGLRQGCPMSPVLFDIFINDILDGLEEFGVEVPGVDGRKLSGLMFADDVVILAPNQTNLRILMHRVEYWADRWEMTIGAPKCGITVFNGDLFAVRREQWTLQGQNIPVVEKYTYLGLEVRTDWDLSEIAAERAERARRALFALRPALSNSLIPLNVKAMMFKSLVVPVASYGGELLGMRREKVRKVQSVLDKGLKWILAGAVSKGTIVAAAALRAELGLPSLYATVSGSRARAWVKYRSLKTWISILVNNPFRARKSTWVTGTSRWLKRIGIDEATLAGSPAWASRRVVDLVWEKENANNKTAGLSHYVKWNFGLTRSYLVRSLEQPNLTVGVRWLTRMRTLGVWMGPRAAKAKLIPDMYRTVCPSCRAEIAEDIPHVLLECPIGLAERQRTVQQGLDQVAATQPDLGREELAVILLGGQAGGVDLTKIWLGTAAHSTWDGAAAYLKVAEFLQLVMPLRMRKLWENHDATNMTPDKRSQSPSGYGSSIRARAGQGGVFSG